MKPAAILVHGNAQIKALMFFLDSLSDEERKSIDIIAIGADVEYALEKKDLSFISGKGLRTMPNAELIPYVEKLGREVLDDPSFSFFTYRGVQLSDLYMPILQNYLLHVLYLIDVITTFARVYSTYKKLMLFPPTSVIYDTTGIFALLEENAAITAARFVSAISDFEVVVLELPSGVQGRFKYIVFNLQRAVFGYVLSTLNAVVAMLIRPKKIRILASDYWRNMSPLMAELPESELLQLDRIESRKTGFAAILEHRMRFIHIEDYLSRSSRKKAEEQKQLFFHNWERGRDMNMPLQRAIFHGKSLASVLTPALRRMVIQGGFQAVRIIDGTYALYEKIKPDIVWVRASVSAQIHFPILCYVAKLCGIPSIEVQHGILYLGPGSFINRPAVEYIATYGPLATEQLKKFGYANSSLPAIGSPRFDVYQNLQRDRGADIHAYFMITCIAPAVLPYSWSDTYEIVDYFSHLAEAASHIPNAHVTIKLRPGGADEAFFRKAITRAFGTVPYHIAQREPLVDVLKDSHVVVAIYSTTVLEGLISGSPVIYDGFMDMHHLLGEELIAYEDAGALLRVRTTEELTQALKRFAQDPQARAAQVERARNFMARNYSFDGQASRRLADTVRELASKTHATSFREGML